MNADAIILVVAWVDALALALVVALVGLASWLAKSGVRRKP